MRTEVPPLDSMASEPSNCLVSMVDQLQAQALLVFRVEAGGQTDAVVGDGQFVGRGVVLICRGTARRALLVLYIRFLIGGTARPVPERGRAPTFL